jgi:hypothetical protein
VRSSHARDWPIQHRSFTQEWIGINAFVIGTRWSILHILPLRVAIKFSRFVQKRHAPNVGQSQIFGQNRSLKRLQLAKGCTDTLLDLVFAVFQTRNACVG